MPEDASEKEHQEFLARVAAAEASYLPIQGIARKHWEVRHGQRPMPYEYSDGFRDALAFYGISEYGAGRKWRYMEIVAKREAEEANKVDGEPPADVDTPA